MAKTFLTANLIFLLLLLSGSNAFCKDEGKTILLPSEDCVGQKQLQKPIEKDSQIKISGIRKNDAILGGTELKLNLISDIGVAGVKKGEFQARTSADLAGFLGTTIPAGTLVTGSYLITEPAAGERKIRLKIWKIELNTDQGKFSIAFDATICSSGTQGKVLEKPGEEKLVCIKDPAGRNQFIESLLIDRQRKKEYLGSFPNNPVVERLQKYKPDFVILTVQSLLKDTQFNVVLNSNVYLPRSNAEAWASLSTIRFDPNTDPLFNSAKE